MTTEGQIHFMRKFPLLLPNSTLTAYRGILSAGVLDFSVDIKVPHYPSLSNLMLQCSTNVSCLLECHKDKLQEWIKTAPSLYKFLENLQNLIISVQKENSHFFCIHKDENLNVGTFKKISAELSAIGFEHIVYISPDFQIIKLKTTDESERCHIIKVDLGDNYPYQPIHIHADLPDNTIKILMEANTLSKIYHSFVQQVTGLQELWNVLDTIDSQCWVIDPETPSRKDIGRRIIIGSNLSVYVSLNQHDVNLKPNITFLGPEQMVLQFQQRMAANSMAWDKKKTIVENLKVIFDIQSFPSKPSNTDESAGNLLQQGECCICYSMRLNDQLPTEVCVDTRCASTFHADCLFQWLQSVPGNYQSFNHIHGVCPNCGTGISCPVSS